MKKRFKKAAAVLLSLTVALTASAASLSTAYAAQASSGVSAGVTVLNVTSSEIAEIGAAHAIQAALYIAGENATDANPYKIVVEPGEYQLDGALNVSGNTTLSLNGVTLKRGGTANMLRVGADGVEGYYHRNIIIEGGTFDGCLGSSTMLKLTHAKNLALRYVAFKNNYNAHMIETACVDGLTVRGCLFDNQKVDAGNLDAYEQLQLDVLAPGNINECGYEDLPMQNVLVEKCQFKNAPRGVGSHTSIFNAPHRGVIIRDNSFYNMGSAAIQTLGWADAQIVRNKIDKAVRAIAVYQIDGSNTYLPSYLSSAGGVPAHYSDTYQPQKSSVVINSNTITNCGTFDDVYAHSSYEKAAISVMGVNVQSGKLPKQVYYCDTVSVINNSIQTKGNGVRTEFSKNINIDGNNIKSLGKANSNDYGVVCRDCAATVNIRKNHIADIPVNGVYIHRGSEVANVNNNEIISPGKYGIGIDGSSASTLSNNEIKGGLEGIAVVNGGKVTKTIIGNRSLNAQNYGVHVAGGCTAAKVEKNLATGASTGFGLYGTVSQGTNYTSAATLTSFAPDSTSVKLEAGNSYRIAKTPSPLHAATTYTYTSNNTNTVKVDSTGRITAVAAGSATVTVKSSGGKTAVVTVNVTAPGVDALGDVDKNGFIDSVDAAKIAGYVSKTSGCENIDLSRADVNGDGKVNAEDRVVLTRFVNRVEGYQSLPRQTNGTAGGECVVAVVAGEAQPGELLKVDVVMEENTSGVAVVELEPEFDESVLTLERVEDGGLFADASAEHSDKLGSPFHLSWVNDLTVKNSFETGVLATLWFRVAEDARPGGVPIRWNTEACELCDKDVKKVAAVFNEGEATVLRGTYTVDVVSEGFLPDSVSLTPAGGTEAVYFGEYTDLYDEEGWYIESVLRMTGVEACDYVLRADKQNCLPLELEVTVEEDCRLALEFRLYGDANRDGRVDISDVTAVQRYIAEFDVDIDVEAAEVVPDGKLNVKDVTEIQRFLAEFIPSLKPTV